MVTYFDLDGDGKLNYHDFLGTYKEYEESISDYSISDEVDGEE